MIVFPDPDEFAKARPFTASAQIDPYYCPPWAQKPPTSKKENDENE